MTGRGGVTATDQSDDLRDPQRGTRRAGTRPGRLDPRWRQRNDADGELDKAIARMATRRPAQGRDGSRSAAPAWKNRGRSATGD